MPVLKRQMQEKVAKPAESLKDKQEVFFCQQTREMFSNYDDFFHHVMILSASVWSCSMTGRSNLTYAEARTSEKSAKRRVKKIPAALKGPLLLIASHTKRSSIIELAADVCGYMKNVFFRGETVYTKTGDAELSRKAKIVRVMDDGPPTDQRPERLIYHVESYDNEIPAMYAVSGAAISRERNTLSMKTCKLFLKLHVELGPEQALCVKKKSLELYVTSKNCTDEKVFYGQMPSFEMSKRLHALKESIQKSSFGSKKQQDIAKYLEKSVVENKNDAETKQKQKEMKKIEQEQRKKEEELLNLQAALVLKHFSTIREDQELTDQRVIPAARPVWSLIGLEQFPDFVFILEFLNSFGNFISIDSKFPGGVKFDVLERALLLREINGPLSDILQLLLGALFIQHCEESSEEEPKLQLKYFPGQLKDLPMNSRTISELLRWYFMSYKQSTNLDDPCLRLLQDHPHLICTLTSYSVYQLATDDVIHIICALIHKLLVSSEVLTRVEKARELHAQYVSNYSKQLRLMDNTAMLKQSKQKQMESKMESFKKTTKAIDKVEHFRNELEQTLQDTLKEIEAIKQLQLKPIQAELEMMDTNECFLNHIYLGMDRGFRKYYRFHSLPGLFVENDGTSIGCCTDRVTRNIVGLAQCDAVLRNEFIINAIMKGGGGNNLLKTDDINGNGLTHDEETCEQLLLRGIAGLEKRKVKSNPFPMAMTNPSSRDEVDSMASRETTAETKNIPEPAPTNQDLFMCTGNAESCSVHVSHSHKKVTWGYYATATELDAFIGSLNQRGIRENKLRVALECVRDMMAERMKQCPTKKLSITEDNRTKLLANLINPQGKQYKQANFLFQPGTEPNEILEVVFCENLLILEANIDCGGLGTLKVYDKNQWRKAIADRSYDSQTNDQLQWGPRRFVKRTEFYKQFRNASFTLTKGKVEDSDMEDVEDTQSAEVESISRERMPDQGVTGSLHATVRSLATALLQVEQSIEVKFLRYPFGPRDALRDRNKIIDCLYEGQKRLLHWEAALMRATSFSQLFLYYDILNDGIMWQRSVERSACIVCKKKDNAKLTLLCDECNRAYHTYCLTPTLKKVPKDDWFCPKCLKEVQTKEKKEAPSEPEDASSNNAQEEKTVQPTRAKRARLSVTKQRLSEEMPASKRNSRTSTGRRSSRFSLRIAETGIQDK